MIHETAIIDTKTKISSNVSIGPYSVIGPDVEIGESTIIHSHVNISGHTTIGKRNKIYPFASIGNDPQDLKYNGEETSLVIGSNNKISMYLTQLTAVRPTGRRSARRRTPFWRTSRTTRHSSSPRTRSSGARTESWGSFRAGNASRRPIATRPFY